MGIDSVHPDYADIHPDWTLIKDITGSKNLKQYLIPLNAHDTSGVMQTRREAYFKRAIFYAIAGQTIDGLMGTMFRKWPSFQAPSRLEYLATNADGMGNSIYQQSQGLSNDTLKFSRAGLYVSHPRTAGPVSRRDIDAGTVVATINRAEPQAVLNWDIRTKGSITKLSLIVIMEDRTELVDYKHQSYKQIRELYLDPDWVYHERLWTNKMGRWVVLDDYIPTDAAGNPWDEIPFIFVGSENNDPSVDTPHSLPLCHLNIGHYRNSADWEDSVFICGQPQPWMSGMTQNQVDFMVNNKMYFGSRELIGVPPGEQLGIAQATPNVLVRQAMLDKLDMMIALGARLVAPSTIAKTATQVQGEREAQHSILSLMASNISEAYTQCIAWAGRYMGVEIKEGDGYTIHQDFITPEVTADILREIRESFLSAAMPPKDYIRAMKKYSLFDGEKSDSLYAEELAGALSGPLGFDD